MGNGEGLIKPVQLKGKSVKGLLKHVMAWLRGQSSVGKSRHDLSVFVYNAASVNKGN